MGAVEKLSKMRGQLANEDLRFVVHAHVCAHERELEILRPMCIYAYKRHVFAYRNHVIIRNQQ